MKTIALAVIDSGEIMARICTAKSDIGIRSGEVLVEFSGRHLDFGDGQLARLVEESQVQRLRRKKSSQSTEIILEKSCKMFLNKI